MKRLLRSNAAVYLGVALVFLPGVCLCESLRRFPPARAHLELWRILGMALTVLGLRAVWGRRR